MATGTVNRAGRRFPGPHALVLALALAVVTACVIATIAIRESNQADAQRDVAASRALAGAALAEVDRSPDLAMLLALEAYGKVHDQSAARSYEARHSLVSALERHPRLLGVLRVGVAGAAAVAFNRDGTELVASTSEGEARRWELDSRSELGKQLEGTGSCYSIPGDADVALAPDGSTLVQTGCGVANVFDLERGARVRIVGGPSDDLGEEETDAEVTPDGRLLAAFGEFAGFRLFDLTTGAQVRSGVGAGHDQLFPLGFSTDGRALAGHTAFTEEPDRVWSVQTGAPIGRPLPGRLLALGPSGELAAVSMGKKIRLWDVLRARRVRALAVNAPVLAAAFDGAGRQFATSTDDSTVRVLRIAEDGRWAREVARLEHDGAVGLRFSPDGSTLATAGMDGVVRLWDLRTLPLAAMLHRAAAEEVAFSPDGRRLAANGLDEGMALWDVAEDGVAGPPRIVRRGIGWNIAFSPDSKTIASGFWDEGDIGLWDVASGRSQPIPTKEYTTYSAAYSPDGRLLGSAGDGVELWDVSTRKRLGKRLGEWFDTIAFSPDGEVLAAWQDPENWGPGKTIRFWDVDDRVPAGSPIRTDASDVSFSPDGRTLAVARPNGTIGLWDVERRILIDTLRAHALTSLVACCAGAESVAFSPDGLMLASVGRTGALRLWDMTRHAPLGGPLPGHGEVWDVAFSPDGRRLASAGEDGTLLWDDVLWSRDLEEWRTRLCRIASRNLTATEWRRFLPDEPYRKTCPELP